MDEQDTNPGVPVVLMPEGLYRWESFEDRVPLSREGWRLRVKNGKAPKAVEIGPRCVAWRGSDVLAWLAAPAEYQA